MTIKIRKKLFILASLLQNKVDTNKPGILYSRNKYLISQQGVNLNK